MISDPAWLYSSLAQASAAIVGLIGAILITRVVEHITLLRTERMGLEKTILGVWRGLVSRRARLADFYTYATEGACRGRQAIAAGTAWREELELGWNHRGGEKLIDDPDTYLSQLERDVAALHVVRDAYRPLDGEITGERLQLLATSLTTAKDLADDNNGAQAILNTDLSAIDDLTRDVARFHAHRLPMSFPTIIGILAWIAAVGIVWPLTALPGIATPGAHPKTWMLAAFALGLGAMLLYSAHLLTDLRRTGKLHWPDEHDAADMLRPER